VASPVTSRVNVPKQVLVTITVEAVARNVTSAVKLAILPATALRVGVLEVDTAVATVVVLEVASRPATPAVAMVTWLGIALRARSATTVSRIYFTFAKLPFSELILRSICQAEKSVTSRATALPKLTVSVSATNASSRAMCRLLAPIRMIVIVTTTGR